MDGRSHATTRRPIQAHGACNGSRRARSEGVLQHRYTRKPWRILGGRPDGKNFVNSIAWPLVELFSKLLEQEEREVVLGDLLETDESAWRRFLDIFGLILRRQADLWKNPRPWLAGYIVTLPGSYLLMIASLSVTCTYQRLVHHRVFGTRWPTGHEGYLLLLCHIFLLLAWSWSIGYMVGSISRRTLWASAALSVLPSVYLCSVPSGLPAKACLFLFLLPAVFGVGLGFRNARISLRSASLLALTTTVLMISAWSGGALWILNWALIAPPWYVAATAWRSAKNSRTGLWPMDRARVS